MCRLFVLCVCVCFVLFVRLSFGELFIACYCLCDLSWCFCVFVIVVVCYLLFCVFVFVFVCLSSFVCFVWLFVNLPDRLYFVGVCVVVLFCVCSVVDDRECVSCFFCCWLLVGCVFCVLANFPTLFL